MLKVIGQFVAVLLLLPTSFALAQDKRIPIGTLVDTIGVFCFLKEDAQVIADNEGKESPEIMALWAARRCGVMQGTAVYIREVYKTKDGWKVWLLRSGNLPEFYEALPPEWKMYDPEAVEA